MNVSSSLLLAATSETSNRMCVPFFKRNETHSGLGDCDGRRNVSTKLTTFSGAASHDSNCTELPSLIKTRISLTSSHVCISPCFTFFATFPFAFLDHISATISINCATEAILPSIAIISTESIGVPRILLSLNGSFSFSSEEEKLSTWKCCFNISCSLSDRVSGLYQPMGSP